jgi:hypothetical protein
MAAMIARPVVLERPLNMLATALTAIVVSEGVCLEKTQKRKQLANSVLQGSSRETKLVSGF